MANLELPFGVKVLDNQALDAKYLNNGISYLTVLEANTIITSGIRSIGLTVNIGGVEYWYRDGISDGDLIVKAGVGGASQLSDLSDVVSATNTNRFALMADGTSYIGRALVEADISDFGAYWKTIGATSITDDATITVSLNKEIQLLDITNNVGISVKSSALGGTEGAIAFGTNEWGLYIDPNNTFTEGNGYFISDNRAGALAVGLLYKGDYTGNFISRSLIDKGFADITYNPIATGIPDGTKFLGDDNTWQTISGGGDALTSNPLSQFAATTKAQLNGVISDGTPMYIGDAPTVHSHLLATGATDVTATFNELNLLDLAGLTPGWILSADSATTASWKSPGVSGDVFKVGIPVNNQMAVWTGDGTIEGSSLIYTGSVLIIPNTSSIQGSSSSRFGIYSSLASPTNAVFRPRKLSNSGLGGNLNELSLIANGAEAVNIDSSRTVSIKGNGFITPVGTDLERIAMQGSIRYNTTTNNFEGYDSASWLNLSVPSGNVVEAFIILTQAQIQALSTTPIEIIAAPGVGRYIQIIGCSAYHNHNGTNYVGGVGMALRMPTLGDVWRITAIIDASSDKIQEGASYESPYTFNDPVVLKASADSTGAGGTINVYVQYVVIDTN